MDEKNWNGWIIAIFLVLCFMFLCLFNFVKKKFSCILLKFVLHVTNNQFLNKLNNGGGRLLSSVMLLLYIIGK